MNSTNKSLSSSLLSLARSLDQQEIIPLARVFGSATGAPDTARDLDIAFFCPDDYASREGHKFASAVASQVLACGNRRTAHYGELDVFVFFPDRALVRNGECSGWSTAKNSAPIKAAALQGQPWLDFIRAVDPEWDRASCPPPRLRQWVCSESPYPLDAQTIASMARAVADLSPWIGRGDAPRNILMEAIEWNHLEIIPFLVAAGAPVMPGLPDDPEEKIDFSGEAYLPSVAALIKAKSELENDGLEYAADKVADLIGVSDLLVSSGADPLQFDLGGNAVNTLDAFMDLAQDIQGQFDEFPVPPDRLAAAMGSLMDTILESLPDDLAASVRRDVCSGQIDKPDHELNRLASSPSVMGLWLASVRHRDLDGGVDKAPVSQPVAPPLRM